MSMQNARSLVDDSAITFDAATTVEVAIDEIRTSTGDDEPTVYYGYVLDDSGRLEGVVSVRELLNAEETASLADVMRSDVVSVEESASIGDIARKLAEHGFPLLPVHDANAAFLGVVRAEDVLEALEEGASKAALQSSVKDVQYDPSEEGQYECFECGAVIAAIGSPGSCPECGSELRHRRTTIE